MTARHCRSRHTSTNTGYRADNTPSPIPTLPPPLRYRSLINARKVAGIHAGSTLHLQENARVRGVYAATVDGRHGELYVRVGGSDADWQSSFSNYQDYREYAQGAGWKVWVKLPGNPEFRQASLKDSLPVPEFTDPELIEPSIPP